MGILMPIFEWFGWKGYSLSSLLRYSTWVYQTPVPYIMSNKYVDFVLNLYLDIHFIDLAFLQQLGAICRWPCFFRAQFSAFICKCGTKTYFMIYFYYYNVLFVIWFKCDLRKGGSGYVNRFPWKTLNESVLYRPTSVFYSPVRGRDLWHHSLSSPHLLSPWSSPLPSFKPSLPSS